MNEYQDFPDAYTQKQYADMLSEYSETKKGARAPQNVHSFETSLWELSQILSKSSAIPGALSAQLSSYITEFPNPQVFSKNHKFAFINQTNTLGILFRLLKIYREHLPVAKQEEFFTLIVDIGNIMLHSRTRRW